MTDVGWQLSIGQEVHPPLSGARLSAQNTRNLVGCPAGFVPGDGCQPPASDPPSSMADTDSRHTGNYLETLLNALHTKWYIFYLSNWNKFREKAHQTKWVGIFLVFSFCKRLWRLTHLACSRIRPSPWKSGDMQRSDEQISLQRKEWTLSNTRISPSAADGGTLSGQCVEAVLTSALSLLW